MCCTLVACAAQLGAGADPALVNKYGETARMVARSRGHVAVVSLIDASISEAEQYDCWDAW